MRLPLSLLLLAALAACPRPAGEGDAPAPPADAGPGVADAGSEEATGAGSEERADAGPAPAGGPPGPTVTEVSFEHAGRAVPAILIRPPAGGAAGLRPLVVLVHGRAGMPLYRERLLGLGERLAAAGTAALVPEYFAATGDPAPAPIDDARFATWRGALAAAADFAGRLDGVDPGRIGVAGFSLGGFLAVAEAAENPRLKAVAANYAGLPDRFPARPGRFPPLLVIHAERDPLAPLAGAQALAARARELGAEVEVVLYPAATHVLEGDDWDDAAARMVAFFGEELGGG